MGLKAVHFGGGNIGRGFVAEKLCQSGFEVTQDAALLRAPGTKPCSE